MNNSKNAYVRLHQYATCITFQMDMTGRTSIARLSQILGIPVEVVRKDMLHLCWSDTLFGMGPDFESEDGIDIQWDGYEKMSDELKEAYQSEEDWWIDEVQSENVDDDPERKAQGGKVVKRRKLDKKLRTAVEKGFFDYAPIIYWNGNANEYYYSMNAEETAFLEVFKKHYRTEEADVHSDDWTKTMAKKEHIEVKPFRIKNEFQNVYYESLSQEKDENTVRTNKKRERQCRQWEQDVNAMIRSNLEEMEKYRSKKSSKGQLELTACEIKYVKYKKQKESESSEDRWKNAQPDIMGIPLRIVHEVSSVEAVIAILLLTTKGYQFVHITAIDHLKEKRISKKCSLDSGLIHKYENIYPNLEQMLDEWLAAQWGMPTYGNYGKHAREADSCHVRVRFYNDGRVYEKVKADVARHNGSLSEIKEVGKDCKGRPVKCFYYEADISGKDAFRSWLRSYGASAVLLEPEDMRKKMIDEFQAMKEMYQDV